MGLLSGGERKKKGLKTSRRGCRGKEALKEKAKERRSGGGEQGESVFPGVSRLSCRVVHHCVPGDCVCGLAPL